MTKDVVDHTEFHTSIRDPRPMYTICSICEKEIKRQGLGGHMWGVHGVRQGRKAELAEMQQRLDTYHEILSKMSHIKVKHLNSFDGWRVIVIPDEAKGKKS